MSKHPVEVPVGLNAFVDNAPVSPSDRVSRGLNFEEPLIFERSEPGRRGFVFSESDWDVERIDVAGELGGLMRTEDARLPEVTEPDVVRHYTRLSQWNYAIDTGFYPLGSCTMKYNPKINEAVARLPGFARLHPYMPEQWCQGALELLWNLERLLCEVAGLPQCSLQPAAGAQGELTGLMCIRAYHQARGDVKRTKIIVPDSAHGTNPASAAFNGFSVVEVPSSPDGTLSAASVAAVMDDTVAGLMITNPNTMGIFEGEIAEICKIVHEGGGKVYMDGANMNAILGKARPGDFGIDVMHYNVHKTFSTPHGGGGPGGGPICVSEDLAPFLPVPRIERHDEEGEVRFRLVREGYESSVGKVKAFLGNFLVYVRAYTYLREYGSNLPRVSERAVLNANYVRSQLNDVFNVAYPGICMHEVVFDDSSYKAGGATTLDIAKRMIDFGIHPPTTYFPLNVPGALMIEPTETESLRTLDEFLAVMRTIHREAVEAPEKLKGAPHNAFRTRLDETAAARRPVLTYRHAQAQRENR
ncbi:aminomethyl-transferring glycine dehydrogenase subunit GcvPB [Lujinxingia litoralis]|uniref:Probable glycine dehydrogenase (decarboxylating) subunit 2 n=1 Tax=Lujinxingia litoralis TaxID=2211119 RepID=A0A328CAC5_9DELT|nr:aminomethyl-transferring glycine dehydrogenase subunit GcvPB [Lujinxingia litoralis]RAL24714.1 aminomethyl-transferring glycine dehydrogenase subunit GcvPB [Lujinxingia litoralis]